MKTHTTSSTFSPDISTSRHQTPYHTLISPTITISNNTTPSYCHCLARPRPYHNQTYKWTLVTRSTHVLNKTDKVQTGSTKSLPWFGQAHHNQTSISSIKLNTKNPGETTMFPKTNHQISNLSPKSLSPSTHG